jgi:hypothetical protein
VVAGNVMAFVAEGTELDVLCRIAAHPVPDAIVVVGFGTDRGYPLHDFDAHPRRLGGPRPGTPVRDLGSAALARRGRLRRQRPSAERFAVLPVYYDARSQELHAT